MKVFFLNLLLWFGGNSEKAEPVVESAKAVIESYSAKDTIVDVYSSKSAKDIMGEIPDVPDLLMEPLQMPILPPLPIFPINPKPITDVNP